MSLKTELEEEIRKEVKELSKLKVGSKEYEIAVTGITKLTETVSNEEIKKKELENSRLRDAVMQKLEEQKLEEEKKSARRNGRIAVGTFVTSAVLYAGTYFVGMKFEELGRFPSFEGTRESFRNLLKIKK